MDFSIAGIEEALDGLGYRETSLKSRLIRAMHTIYKKSASPDEVRTIDSDELIDQVWNLGGNEKAIKARRKNLSSIKSSVNKDFDAAWEDGRNPEGITIGPLNTFIMSDAAKDKILNAFTGSIDLEGGKTLDRVAEALKIVSDYLSETPADVDGEQMLNLKTLIEGLSEKLKEDGDDEIKVIEKIIYRDGSEDETGGPEDRQADGEEGDGDEDNVGSTNDVDLAEKVEEIEEDLEDVEALEELVESEEGEGEDDDAIEIVEEEDIDEAIEDIEDLDDLEIIDEDDIIDGDDEDLLIMEEEGEAEGVGETAEEGEIEIEEADAGEGGDENVVELVGAEDLEDADEVEIVYEDATDDLDEAGEDAEIDAPVEDVTDEASFDDEGEVVEEAADALDEVMADVEIDDDSVDESEPFEIVEEEEDLLEEVAEDSDAIGEEMEIDEVEMDDAEEIELMDEDGVIDAPDDIEEVVEDELDELEEVLEDDAGEDDPGGEDVVELVGADGLEAADEVELVDEDDLIEGEDDSFDDVEETMTSEGDAPEDDTALAEEEVVEAEEPGTDETMSTEEMSDNDIGLPIDQMMEDLQNFDEFQPDEKQKRLLAERFDGYLGAMERYYNQYIIVKKGNYQVGADASGEDVLNRQQVLMANYYMGKYPVTNALFEVFIERTGYKTTAEKLGYGYVYHGRFRKVVDPNTGFTSSIWNSTYTREKVKGATWFQPLGPGSTLHKKRNHPVVQVSIQDARTFAAWTGKRLPTEIEWEAAARSNAGFRYPWGNEWIEGFCNFENSGVSDTCPVDHFPHSTNEAGIADLLGNIMEWTSDECDPKYPLETPARFFIAKGGSWVSPEQTTLYSRSRLNANFTSNTLGFRCLAD